MGRELAGGGDGCGLVNGRVDGQADGLGGWECV